MSLVIGLRAGHRVLAPCRFGAPAQRKAVATYKSRIKAPLLSRHQPNGAHMRKMILMAIAGFLWRKFMARRATTAASGPALTGLAPRTPYPARRR